MRSQSGSPATSTRVDGEALARSEPSAGASGAASPFSMRAAQPESSVAKIANRPSR